MEMSSRNLDYSERGKLPLRPNTMLDQISVKKDSVVLPSELYKKKEEKQPRVQQQQFKNQLKKLS